MNKNKRYAVIIILVSNAIIISLLESLIPIPIPVPGVKLGLANIIILIGIVFLPLSDVLLIVIIRSFVVALLTRGIMTVAFSLGGGIISALVMALLYKKFSRFFSIKGISVVGAILHNTTQLAVAYLLLGEAVVLLYFPILLVSAVITGLITGSIGEMAISEIRKKEIFAAEKQLSN
ncbi:MAG: heptaprenyl diphosphate synthase [Desulfitibacter sp. BRH_c19]|nr:MAG: heptaprenyl diphosphate synthase [Desulfitibacter sp. BRH_c19]